MSEFGGILYDLNEDAKTAVSAVKDRGDIPYAVCRSQTEIGDLYAVLFVSPDKNGWDFERPDREGNCFCIHIQCKLSPSSPNSAKSR